MSDNPFSFGATLPDEIHNALVPLDGYPKGSRPGPRPYLYSNGAGVWWVIVSVTDFGDEYVGQSGPVHPDALLALARHLGRQIEAERFRALPFWRKVLAYVAHQGPGQR